MKLEAKEEDIKFICSSREDISYLLAEVERLKFLAELPENDVDQLKEYKQQERDGLLLKLPCKIGALVYEEGLESCQSCLYGKDVKFESGFKDMYGDPIADDCEDTCPMIVRSSLPFSLDMLNNNGTLVNGYYLTERDCKAAMQNEED